MNTCTTTTTTKAVGSSVSWLVQVGGYIRALK